MGTSLHFRDLPCISGDTGSIPGQRTKVPLPAEQLSLHTLELMCHNYWSLWALESVSLSLGFPRQEYWSGLPFLPPGDLSNPWIKPTSSVSPTLQEDPLPSEPSGKPKDQESNPGLCSDSQSDNQWTTREFPMFHSLNGIFWWKKFLNLNEV